MSLSLAERRQREGLEQAYIELEWRRCAEDFTYFLTHWVFIESKRDPRGYEKFVPLPYQLEDAEAFANNRYVCVLKARQLGITTLVCAYSLFTLLFRPGGGRVLMLSKDQNAASDNLDKMRVQWRLLPEWMKARAGTVIKDGESHWELRRPEGAVSEITSLPATKTTGAGNTADVVVLDEFGLVEYQAEVYKTILPTTLAAASNPHTRGAVLLMLSTARGGTNLFAATCRAAQRGENEFAFLFHPWHVSPFMTQADYDNQARFWEQKGEPWMLYSEFPDSAEQAFRESGRPRFVGLPDVEDGTEFPDGPGRLVQSVDQATGDDTLEFVPSGDGRLWIAEHPRPDRRYVIGIDPASGRGGDYTVATVLALDGDGDPYLAAYWWANTVEPFLAGAEFDDLGRYYASKGRPALLAVEKQGGHGDSVITTLRGRGYRNLYSYTPVEARKRRLGPVIGLPMSKTQRPKIIDRLAEFLPRTGNLHPRLLTELHTFVRRDDGTVAADTGCHDDLVMSLAIAMWVLVESAGVGNPPQPSDMGEAPAPTTQTLTVGDLYAEAAAVRRASERVNRRVLQRVTRARRR